MSYLDKTFCASPNCTNDCGRRMTDEEHQRLIYLNNQYVSYGYFCGEPDDEDCEVAITDDYGLRE